jgi:hypothetical protein
LADFRLSSTRDNFGGITARFLAILPLLQLAVSYTHPFVTQMSMAITYLALLFVFILP